MSVLKIVSLAVIVSQTLASPYPQAQEGKEQKVAAYDPQLLNHKLQQLGLQPSGLQIQGTPFHAQIPSTSQPQTLTTAQENPNPIQQLYIQYLQNKLFQPSNEGSLDFAPTLQATQTLRQRENLLGVAFSSASDTSKIMFTGHGIHYSF